MITLPALFGATLDESNHYLDDDRDTSDYYKFVAPVDGLFECIVTHRSGYPGDYLLRFSETTWSNTRSTGKLSTDGTEQLVRWNLVAGRTYYIRVTDNNDLQYQLKAGYLP